MISRRAGLLLAIAVLCVTRSETVAEETASDAWKIAEPSFSWSFPEDHWAHDGYRTEWWYFTGHLFVDGETSPSFGYQFTFFKVAIARHPPKLDSEWATQNLVMGHASISDLRRDRHVFSDVLHREVPMLGGFGVFPDSVIAWCRAPAGTSSDWSLSWNGDAFDFSIADEARGVALDLSTHPKKPPIFQGPGGYSQKGREASQASLYYSFTRLGTSGTIRLGDDVVEVVGESWMDKEFGSNQLGSEQVGWDWFSLQLDDGREIMLYELRDAAGEVDFARGTVVPRRGAPRYLARGDWTTHVSAHWRSPTTDTVYPAGWSIELPREDLILTIVPEMPGQENVSARSSGIAYWEGAVEVKVGGASIGRGYVELTGYGGRNRPRL